MTLDQRHALKQGLEEGHRWASKWVADNDHLEGTPSEYLLLAAKRSIKKIETARVALAAA